MIQNIKINIHPPLKHIELWYFSREALKLVKSSSEGVLLLPQNKKSVTIQDWIENCGELLREPQRSFYCICIEEFKKRKEKLLNTLRPDLDLGVDGVFIQTCQDDAGVIPAGKWMNAHICSPISQFKLYRLLSSAGLYGTLKQFSNPREPLRQKDNSLEVWFKSAKLPHQRELDWVHTLLTHIHFIRVVRNAVAIQPVQIPRLRQQIEPFHRNT